MIAFVLAASVLAAPVPAKPAEKPVEATRYTGHYERNDAGLKGKGDVSVLAFTDAESFRKVFSVAPPVMGKGGTVPSTVKDDAFEKSLIVAVVRRGNSIVTYSGMKAVKAGDTLIVRYDAEAGKAGTATFASPLILGVPKDGIKEVVFEEGGKQVGKVEVK